MNQPFEDSNVNWQNQMVHCIDFEGSRRSGVVEYGIVSIQALEVKYVETRLCCPTGIIPEMETATHKIRTSDVEAEEPLSESWDLFRDLRKSGPFAAHHAGVENGLIKSVWPFTSPSPNFISGVLDVEWGPWLDSCALYRALFPGLESYNLASLIRHFDLLEHLEGLSLSWCPETRCEFHCAAFDALASAVLILQLANYEGIKSWPLSQLLQWSQPGGAGQDSSSQLELL